MGKLLKHHVRRPQRSDFELDEDDSNLQERCETYDEVRQTSQTVHLNESDECMLRINTNNRDLFEEV